MTSHLLHIPVSLKSEADLHILLANIPSSVDEVIADFTDTKEVSESLCEQLVETVTVQRGLDLNIRQPSSLASIYLRGAVGKFKSFDKVTFYAYSY